MLIGQQPRAPVVTGRKRNPERPGFDLLPMIKLVHDVETEIVHQVPNTGGNDDRLVRRDPAQAAPIEMIKMRVGHEDEID